MSDIPAFLVMTPEARKAAWARWDAEHQKEETMKVGPKEQQVRDLKAKRTVEERASKSARTATLRAMIDAVDGPKKVAFDQALATAQGRDLDAVFLSPTLTAPAAAQPQETTMKTPVNSKPKTTTKAKTTKPLTAKQRGKSANASTTKAKASDARARKSAKENARTPVEGGRPDGLREGSKQAQMIDLALRQEGATEKAICAELGWKKCRVTLKRVAEKIGAKLEGKKNIAGETVWFATMARAA